jgi:hypothetical protein
MFFFFFSEMSFTCSDYEFECDDGYCIDKTKRCDGTFDCADNSDEKQCPTNACKNSTQSFQCANFACIAMNLVCDGVNDCGDESDESPECSTFTFVIVLSILKLSV